MTQELEQRVQEITKSLTDCGFSFEIKKEKDRLPRLFIRFGKKHFSCFAIGYVSIIHVETSLDNGKLIDSKSDVCAKLKNLLPNYYIII